MMNTSLLLLGERDRPTIDWSFLGSIPNALTHTRAATTNGSTYFGPNGQIKYAGTNEPRFQYNPVTLQPVGLLLEGQRQNLIPHSYLLSNWSNNNALSTTDNALTSPDGTTNATVIVTDTAPRGRYRTVTVTAATTYAVSGFVRSTSGDPTVRVGTEVIDGVSGFIRVNTSTGTSVAAGAPVQNLYSVLLSNGWTYYRYTVTTGAAQTSIAYIAYSHSTTDPTTFSVWGVQVEATVATYGEATSYIPTAGASVTRPKDQGIVTPVPWFNQSAGSFVFPYTAADGDVGWVWPLIFSVGDNESANSIGVQISSANVPHLVIRSGNVVQTDMVFSTLVAGTTYKFGFAWDSSGAYGCVSGGAVTTDTVLTLPVGTIDRLRIGNGSSSAGTRSGLYKGLKYWNRKLTPTELQRITT